MLNPEAGFHASSADPDFRLRIIEGYCNKTWRSWHVKRLAFTAYNDGLLIRVDPPLTGGECGSHGFDTPYLLISPKLQGDSLFPISDLPLHVYVFAISRPDPHEIEYLADSEIKKIGFGVIFGPGQENTWPKRSFGYPRPDIPRIPQ